MWAPAQAATIVVGSHLLQPNTPHQLVPIVVNGGEMVSGLDLFIQVGDGGPALADLGLPAGTLGPKITSVDLKNGTIFSNVQDQPTNLGSLEFDQTAFYTLALIGEIPEVPSNGLLATLTLDTTGLYGGNWDLQLNDVLPFSELSGPYATSFVGAQTRIENGALRIEISIGDFDGDDQFGAGDIDVLSAAIRSEDHLAVYDVNTDGDVNMADRTYWVETIARTYFGDSNLDGEFNTTDLVLTFQSGQYEDMTTGNSTWGSGDWDGNGDYESSDLVLAFQSGGYEQGRRLEASPPRRFSSQPVPEPATPTLWLFGLSCWLIAYRQRSNQNPKVDRSRSFSR